MDFLPTIIEFAKFIGIILGGLLFPAFLLARYLIKDKWDYVSNKITLLQASNNEYEKRILILEETAIKRKDLDLFLENIKENMNETINENIKRIEIALGESISNKNTTLQVKIENLKESISELKTDLKFYIGNKPQ